MREDRPGSVDLHVALSQSKGKLGFGGGDYQVSSSQKLGAHSFSQIDSVPDHCNLSYTRTRICSSRHHRHTCWRNILVLHRYLHLHDFFLVLHHISSLQKRFLKRPLGVQNINAPFHSTRLPVYLEESSLTLRWGCTRQTLLMCSM